MRFLFLPLLLAKSAFTQVPIEGMVTDIRGTPLPYTNIVLLKNNRGTMTDSAGHFKLSNASNTDSIKISNISYKTKIIPLDSITKKICIRLEERITTLEDVLVPNFSAFKKIKRIGYISQSHNAAFRLQPGNQLAIYVHQKENKAAWIKKIIFELKDIGSCKSSFRLRLMEADSLYKGPGNDLLQENIVVPYHLLKKRNSVDISRYHVLLPNEGVFVVLEWLDNRDSDCRADELSAVDAGSGTSIDVVWFNYRDRQWSSGRRRPLSGGTFMTPALGLEIAVKDY